MNTYNADGLCPKCCFNAITDKFFKGSHSPCSVSDAVDKRQATFQFCWMPISDETAAYLDELDKEINAVPEHIERTCLRCSFVWAEATMEKCE